MAAATIADLGNVGITLDHIACTSGPLLLPPYGITLIMAVAGAFCPLITECHAVILSTSAFLFHSYRAA